MRTSFDAIIIGAGPAGSTAAIRLAQAGWSVALIEKQRFPRRKVCGECLAANNLPLLDALGIGSRFHALAGPELKRVTLMHGAESIDAELPAYADTKHAWGKAVAREHLDLMLLQRAEELGVSIMQPCTAREVKGKAGAYECLVRTGEEKAELGLSTPLLIAAHGSWAPDMLLHQYRETEAKETDLFAFKANFTHAMLEEGVLPVLAFRGGYGGMVSSGHNLLTLACCIRRDRLAALRRQMLGKSAGEAVQSYLMAECKGVREALARAQAQGKWLSVGPLRPGVRMPRGGGEFFLVGNAAGEAHPIIGEGMSMAMQAAWLLCDKLLSQPCVLSNAAVQRTVLRDYAQAWHTQFARRLFLAVACAHLAMHPAAARMVLPILRAWPGMMTRAARWSGKVSRPPFVQDPPTGVLRHSSDLEHRLQQFSNGENA